jgi:hypothetical protein
MGKQIFKYAGINLVFIVLFSFSTAFAEEFEKSIKKSYDVNKDASLILKNKFGEIRCETWDKNVISINVQILVDARNEQKAQRVFDKIDVEISGSKNLVEVITHLESINGSSVEFSINYKVFFPETITLNLVNKFGNTYLSDIYGPSKIKISYGDIYVDGLLNENNKLEVAFGDASIDKIRKAYLEFSHSEISIDDIEIAEIDSKFSELSIDEIGELDLVTQHDDIEIDRLDLLILDSQFSDIEIGKISRLAEIDIQYGGCSIETLDHRFEKINIISSFSDVKIGIDNKASFSVSAKLKFGDLRFPKAQSDIWKFIERPTSTEIEGVIGSEKNPSSSIVVDSKNGDVKLYYK